MGRFYKIDSDISEYITIDDGAPLAELFRSGRQQLIEYVISRYGSECICQIGTFGKLMTRSVLKDVARVLKARGQMTEEDSAELNKITKLVPAESGKQWTLEECIYGDPVKDMKPIAEILAFAEKHPKLFEIALELQGLPRHPSIHAAGVVISPVPIRELIPLMRGADGEIVAQFEMGIIEELGIN
jgi:DNA polymerase-3 subunit alpha